MSSCIVCKSKYDQSSHYEIGTCKHHSICYNCFEKCKDKKFTASLGCKKCEAYFNPESSYLKFENCCYCSLNQDLTDFCIAHHPCQACIKSDFDSAKDKVSNKCRAFMCYKCTVIKKNLCRGCFKMINNIYNKPICTEHVICNACLNKQAESNRCIECITMHSPSSDPVCISCHKQSLNIYLNLCQYHCICCQCSSFQPEKSALKTLTKCLNCQFTLNQMPNYTSATNYFDFSPVVVNNYATENYANMASFQENYIAYKTTGILTPASIVNSNESYYNTNYQQSLQVYTNQTMKIPQSDTIFCHNNYCSKLECGHPNCIDCFNLQFRSMYKEFIYLLSQSNTSELNRRSFEIRCSREECLNKYCYPFSSFQYIAYEIVRELGYCDIIVEHYSLLFEGIRMKFDQCKNCKYSFGYANNFAKCIFCNQIN